MMKRIICLALAVILYLGLAVSVWADYRNGMYILDNTGHLPYNEKSSLQQEAELYSQMAEMDILYVRTNLQNLDEYAKGLKIGERQDQVMLIENDEVQKVLFFGKAKLLSQEDGQELLAVYNGQSVSSLGVYCYMEAALSLISKRRDEGLFNQVLAEQLEQMPRLQDDAGLLSGGKRKLQMRLDEISERYKMDILMVTVQYLDTKSPEAYAREYRKNHVFGSGEYKDGLMLLASGEDFWLFPLGMGSRTFTEAGLNYIYEQIKKVQKKEGFDQAVWKYADLCEDFMIRAASGKPYDGVDMPKIPFRLGLYIVISVAAGLIAGCVVLYRHKDELTSVRFHYDAEDYMKTVDVDAMKEERTYLYSTTETRLKS